MTVLSHPIYGLAQACFTHTRALVGSTIPRRHIDRACSFVGVGLDHVSSEIPLAFADEPVGVELQHYFLATDRRIFGRYENRPYCIAYPDIAQIQYFAGPRGPELEIVHAQGRQRLSFPSTVEPLARFLQTIAAQHPTQRTPPESPLVTPRADDPAGAWLACGRLAEDARAGLIARVVAEKVARSEVPASGGSDLVARVTLHHRLAMRGPGAKDGWWLSALSAQDLATVFVWLVGAPVSHQMQGPMHQIVYAVPMGPPPTDPSAQTAMGLAARATAGVGWMAHGGPMVGHLRLTMRDTPSSSSFTIEGSTGGPPAHLTALAPGLQAGVLGALSHVEAHLLLCRAIYGWSMPSDQLGTIPGNDLVANASGIVGAFDAALFFPPA